MTRIGWHAGMVRVDDAYAPMALAPSLIHQHALVGLYRMGDDGPEYVGNVYPDRTGENVVAMLDGKEWAIPWPTMVAMKMGRDFGIVAAAMIVAGLALVWAVSAALDLVDLAGETVRDRRDAL